MTFYLVHLRPIVEYTRVTYHSMISREQSGSLEQGQSRALKVIYGPHKSYRALLEESSVEKLEERRINAFKTFSQKCANNQIVNAKWLPLNIEAQYDVRQRNVYLEENARTEKLYRSPIFAMRRYLNSIN